MGLTKSSICILSILGVLLILLLVYNSFFTQSSVEQRILAQKNYRLQLADGNFAIKFDFEPGWSKLKSGQTLNLMKKIFEDDGIAIYIEEVVRPEKSDRLHIALKIESIYKLREGKFLIVDRINPDGSVSTVPGKGNFSFDNGLPIDSLNANFGKSIGSGNRISIFFDSDFLPPTAEPFQIEYSGLQLYQYTKV